MAVKVLDFTNVKESSGVNPKHQPAGDYHGKIVSLDDTPAKASGNDMWTFAIQDMDLSSATYPYRCTLNEEALWKLRNLIVATGKDVPKKRIKFDPNTLVGKEIGMTLEDEEYDGKMRSVITTVFPVSDLPSDEDEEDEKPVKKKAKAAEPAKKKAKAKPVDDDEDDDEEEDMDELDIDEL